MIRQAQSTGRRNAINRTWGRIRWRLAAIVVFTGVSTILAGCLAVAALNVMVRREGANVVEKQIQALEQASRPVASAILDNSASCTASPSNSVGLKPLLAYTNEVFPQAEAALKVETDTGTASDLRDPSQTSDFAGLAVDHGRLEIRNIITRQLGGCRATASFSLPLGSQLAKRLSVADSLEVMPVSPRPFRVHSPGQRVFRTIEGNFLPGFSRPAAVVLTVRNWQSGAMEDWIAYIVRPNYQNTFQDVARLGSHLANWVWLGTAFAALVFIFGVAGVWICIRLDSNIATSMDGLSAAAHEIALGNFAWRAPVRGEDQLGDLSRTFNEMAVALERFQKEQAVALRTESELQVARTVQGYLFPGTAPVVNGVTVAGRTLAARTVGGDLYDYFELGQKKIGILCADVSGKGIPAALMMANLQALVRAHVSNGAAIAQQPKGILIEVINRELTGRFGNNRYATLFWAEYDANSSVLTYVNAGNPPPIVIRADGEIERLEADSFPVGMFANATYAARELPMRPGSRVVIFTDGLTDAQNVADEEFGEERLIASCRMIDPMLDAKASADILMKAVTEWSIGTEPFDDTTVVVIDLAAQAGGTTMTPLAALRHE
jgi:serine phosphatase RsbU (regulator of sigma subunit)